MIPNWFVSLFLTDSGDACIFFPIDAQASGVNCGSMSLSNTFCIGWQGIKIAGLDTFANLTGSLPPPPPARSSQLQTHTLQVFLFCFFCLLQLEVSKNTKISHNEPGKAGAKLLGPTTADTHNIWPYLVHQWTHTHANTHRTDAQGHALVSMRSPSCTCAGKCTSLWFPERLLGSQSPVFLLNAAGPKMTNGGRQDCWRSDTKPHSRACHRHYVLLGKRMGSLQVSKSPHSLKLMEITLRYHKERCTPPRLASTASRHLFKSTPKYVD